MRHDHRHTLGRGAARLAGLALGLTLTLALHTGVALGHQYDPQHPAQAAQTRSLLSPSQLAAPPRNCSNCTKGSSGACYNGCEYGGITYYYRGGLWYAYDGTNWYCYIDGCWQVWAG